MASGAGLFNMSEIASKLLRSYEIDNQIIGFDTGEGMPAPVDYKDHPEYASRKIFHLSSLTPPFFRRKPKWFSETSRRHLS